MELEACKVSHRVAIFLIEYKEYYNKKELAKKLDISPQTLSRRIYSNDWLFDELRALKRLFKQYGLTLKL